MAAKSISEAIDYGAPSLGEMQKKALINELRDFFSHQVMYFEIKAGLGLKNDSASEFFNHVFKSYPPHPGENK